jgi:conjugative transfer signal peptidase TraF
MTITGSMVGMLIGIAALVASSCIKPTLRIVYNASDSAPRGWYAVGRPDHIDVGDYVVARLPDGVATFAAGRGYLARSIPVLKRVAAIGGQHVCVREGVVFIDGVPVADTLNADRRERPLAAWSHCRRLVSGELFLLNTSALESFDSRYFGPLDASFVRGRAIPLAASAS